MTSTEQDGYFSEGVLAWETGFSREDCPHDFRSEERERWLAGYDHRQRKMEANVEKFCR